MRTTLLALVLVLVACGRSDRATTPAHDAPTVTNSGLDQLVLQIPRNGGSARVLSYPGLDSVVWTSAERVPSATEVLAFDDNAGSVVLVDGRGAPVRIDFRLGRVTRQPTPRLTKLASADGWSVFGLAEDGRVVRLTPLAGDGAAPWTLQPPVPASRVAPQLDGSLLVIAERDEQTRVFRVRPPDTTVLARADLPRTMTMAVSGAGDRVYFVVDTGLVGLRPRDLAPAQSLRLRGEAMGAVTTPSGDRVYIAVGEGREIAVIHRYRGGVEGHVQLPGQASELRMDPTGRVLLARPATGDSIWVVSLATDRVTGTVQSGWRADLPAVAPDGAMAVLRGTDVALLDPQTLAVRQTVAGGAGNVWYFFAWNGFRPRPTGLDEPATFPDVIPAEPDPEPEPDSMDPDPPGQGDGEPRPSPRPQPSPQARAPLGEGFVVQFAALRSEESARQLASELRVRGAPPRVLLTRREGIAIYRVLAGPYPTRQEAERVGEESGRSYWVYEGMP